MIRRRRAFTLVEILVVTLIVLLLAAVVLPAVVSSLGERQIVVAAQSLQAALIGARDEAVRQHPPSPAGIRLLPDPTLTVPSFAGATPTSPAGSTTLAYNRWVALVSAPDYTSGKVTIGPMLPAGMVSATFPPPYPMPPFIAGDVYPYSVALTQGRQVLMIEESPFIGGFTVCPPGGAPTSNEPTSWYWNIRVGDRIRPHDSGQYYTVVGPMSVTPTANLSGVGAASLRNPEQFVNVGPPGATPPLVRTYYDTAGNPVTTKAPEFLFLVNGIDDDKDGYIDEGFNGFDDSLVSVPAGATGNGFIDEVVPVGPPGTLNEWETEVWFGSASGASLSDPGPAGLGVTPTPVWVALTNNAILDVTYSIQRRPVPSESMRETALPGGIVIDATGWNASSYNVSGQTFSFVPERSRLPIDPNSLTVDIMVNANGQVIPTTTYSTLTSQSQQTFYFFWLAERADVLPPQPQPAPPAVPTVPYLLAMPKGSINYPNAADALKRTLAGEKRMLTLFPKTGLIDIDTIDNFDGTNVNAPFLDAQEGMGAGPR